MAKKMATPRIKRDRKAELQAIIRAVIAFWPIWFVATTALAGLLAYRYWPAEWRVNVIWERWTKPSTPVALDNIHVHGELRYLSPETVRDMVREAIQQDVIKTDLTSVQAHLLTNAWVRQVRIKRRPPADLDVFVEERRPLARWQERGLVDVNGEVFIPEHMPTTAPKIFVDVPKDSVREALLVLRQAVNKLAKEALRPVGVGRDVLGTWRVELANGVSLVLGRTDLPTRLERVTKVWPAIVAYGAPETLDVRYKHGIAVRYLALREAQKQEN